ncbi:LysR family transcriptional regulator [Mammaliicoccus lentus]|uniref:LysR family transcriptional regulator n=1 Tax=Mammaliicoccus lentus TaxID=42858 RepID=A0AAX3W622_MAMLE|nr:LysR family transcriptional regulator [Mammaliicoccus lentus]WHI60397.1 LysR family transcriptional regulator [Mammaliicoccus lentus]
MNIEYINDFIKVAEQKSLSKASNILNISTPALSKRIKNIEEYFECELFYRTSRGIFLTEQGELVLSNLISLKNEIETLKLQLSKINKSTINIGLLPSFSLYKWSNQSESAIKNTLSIKIQSNTQVLLNDLYNGDIEVIIGDITSLNSKDLHTKTLYQEKYMVVFSNESRLSTLKSVNINILKNENILTLSPPCDTLSFIQQNFSNIKLNIEYRNDLESILASVKAGHGITIIPQSLSMKIENMNLESIELEDYLREIGLISYNQNVIKNVYSIISE